MILQTGLRTDIPAFYAPWLANRLREGFVLVRNPYVPHRVTKFRISPDVVDLVGFCSKNPAPFFPYLELLSPYRQFWFVTITPYGKEIEPHVPDKNFVIETFRKLSAKVGKARIGWRYDPIFISKDYTVERHVFEFGRMASALAGATDFCIISFIDLYAKVLRNFPEVSAVPREQQIFLAKEFVRIGQKFGIQIKSCAEGNFLSEFGVDVSGCMSRQVLERAVGSPLKIPAAKFMRDSCPCIGGSDIGAYDTCGHLCRYCYATSRMENFEKNRKLHDPNSPMLIGNVLPEDKIETAKQESWIDPQTDLWI